MDALGRMPYAQVYELVAEVRRQANAQLGLSAVTEGERSA